MRIRDIYANPNEKLTNDQICFLRKKGYVFNYNTTINICKNHSLFIYSLGEDFKKTINCILRYDFKYESLYDMTDKESESILNKLLDMGFVFDKGTVELMQYNSLFLIASLENDYYKTMMYLNNQNAENCFIVPSFSRENKLLENILIKNGFCLDNSNIHLVISNSSFLFASLKNDFYNTLEALGKMKVNISNMVDEEIIELIEILFTNTSISFYELPIVVKNVVVKYLKESFYNKWENEVVYNLIIKGKIPLTYMCSDNLYANGELLYSGLLDKNVANFLYERIGKYNFYRFSYKDEEILLNLLGKKYKRCSCVEDVIRKMNFLKLTRDKMSLLEMFAIELYGAKELYKVRNKCYVNVFNFKDNFNNFGSSNKDMVNININGMCNTVFDMVNTLHHEIEHIIQQDNISNGYVNRDIDVMNYYKDKILRKILGDSYYEENYEVVFAEYDADLKAYIKSCRLFNVFKNADSFDSVNKKFQRIMNYSLRRIQHKLSFVRCYNGEYFTLNKLFERVMNNLRITNYNQYLSYMNDYPFIKYEFKCDDKFRRKTIEELLDEFVCCNKKEDNGIYFNLLRLRLDANKEDNDSIVDNIDTLESLYTCDKYDEKVKKVILKLIESYSLADNRKYRGYFNRINKSK